MFTYNWTILFIQLTTFIMKSLLLFLSLCVVGHTFAQSTQYQSTDTPKLKFIELDAVQKKHRVELTWMSTLELEGDFFAVERSADGENFSPIKGALATNLEKPPKPYTALDFEPYTVSYYRIQQTDATGHVNYSSVKEVKLKGIHFAEAYINPKKNNEIQVLVNLDQHKGFNIIVSDTEEKQLYNVFLPRSTGEEPYTIDMNDFDAGTYMVNILTSDRKYTYKEEIVLEK